MRNLKRALSLAMASVMLLGMMVVGTGASYADVDSADNVEAIEVMQAVGVMVGDTNGNFNPDQKVTRGEMAVVMANLLNLNVKDFIGAKTPFTDVPEWAVPYVAACYADGITAGISATQYGFNYEVTTAQAALMMMKALGYFQYTSDFGSDWQVATVKQGSKINLFDGVEAGASTAMTRNDVAQIALNTLEANVVEAEGNDGISIGDVTIGSSIKYVDLLVAPNAKYQTISNAKDSTGTKDIVQLGEQLFDGKLEKAPAGADVKDEFARPGYTWRYNSKDVSFAVEKPVAVFTAKTSASDVAKALSGYTVNSLKINNVDSQSGSTGSIVFKNGAQSATSISISSETVAKAIADETKNGMVWEFYDANDDDAIDAIIQIEYTVDTVSDVTTNKTGTTYTLDGGESGIVYAEDQDKDNTIVIAGTIAEDDVVTYVKAANNTSGTGDDILYVFSTTKVVGTQSAKATDTITVSGTKYDVALGVSGVAMSGFANSNDEANFYMDQYGYVVKSDAIASQTNYAIVDKIALVGASGTAANQSVEAVLAFADGSTKTVNVSKINGIKAKDITNAAAAVSTNGSKVVTGLKLSSTVGDNNALTGVAVSYTEKNGSYELTYLNLKGSLTNESTKANIFDNYAVSTSSDDASATTVTVVEKGVPTVMGYGKTDASNDTTVVANNKTVYLVKTGSGDDEKFATYTGFKNVPTIKITGGAEASGANDAHAYVSYATGDNGVEFIYIDATDSRAAAGDTATGDILYVSSTTVTESLVGDDTIYELTGIVNGVEGVTVKSEDSTMFSGLTKGQVYELTTDNDGYVTAKTEQITSGTAYIKATVDTNEAKNGILDTNGTDYTYDGTEKVIVIDDDTIIGNSINSAKNGDTVYVKVVDKNGDAAEKLAIEVIYIVKA